MPFDVIVIGAGAAGMMAACTSASLGKNVLLLEKNSMVGRKLRITGKGRCNVTNDSDAKEFLKNIPSNPNFLYGAINRFSTSDTKDFFENKGVALKTERGNRVFPVSDRAIDIVKALEDSCKANNVTIKNEIVSNIIIENGFIKGVSCQNGKEYLADSVIIATGGMSYPLTGSTGDGYEFAKSAGHTITKIKPSLVPLVCKDEDCTDMQGLSLKNVMLSLFDKKENKLLFKELGEMLFTHFGISGPLVLSASSHIKEMEKGRYLVSIDLKPGLDEKQLDERILRDFKKYQNKIFANSLDDLLPKKIIPIILRRVSISPLEQVNSIKKEQRKELCDKIKNLNFYIDNFAPIDEAIITSGGVNVKEINPKTMESKLINGLYFAGEVLDVDGYTGGFNLQIAFSTGYVAGLNA